MKKILLMLAALAVSAATMYGQGRVFFNNTVSQANIKIAPGSGQGPAGGYVGGDYSVQLLWAPGTLDATAWAAATKSSSTPTTFFGATGGSPTTDGAGVWDGGTVQIGPVGLYTFQAVAWYNGGTYATYAAAEAAQKNVGASTLITLDVTASPATPKNTVFNAFTVASVVPEPSTFALAGLGLAGLVIFRRRK